MVSSSFFAITKHSRKHICYTKALSEFMFDMEVSMIQIDMSKYMEKHIVFRLLGTQPGYVGYHEGGQLTDAVGIMDGDETIHEL
jgi:hypothetical protein